VSEVLWVWRAEQLLESRHIRTGRQGWESGSDDDDAIVISDDDDNDHGSVAAPIVISDRDSSNELAGDEAARVQHEVQ
jgi:hypothetical protein